jgi:predicted  nucleic acid-binding Zn-ribbon protein
LENNKLKFKDEIQALVKSAQSQGEVSKDRDMLRQARRELEEAKRRVEEYQKECNALRKQRDELKDTINDTVIAHNKQIEDERTKKREAISQNDKLKFRIRALEDDVQVQILESDKKSQNILKLKNEKQNLKQSIDQSSNALLNEKKHINELKDMLKDKENELQSYIRRNSDQETHFELVERRRFEKMQTDLDTLGKEFRNVECGNGICVIFREGSGERKAF